MKKGKLLGIGKSELRTYYILPKKQDFFKICRQLLLDLGVKKFDSNSFARPSDKKFGEPIFDKEENIKNYIDRYYSFTDEKEQYSIELVFGKDKVFLIIYSKTDKQQEISKIVNKFLED